MAQLGAEVGHVFAVNDLFGAPVNGLTSASFTKTLRRRSGVSLIATTEPVTIQAIGGGEYWAFYTPTLAATLYTLTVTPVAGTQVTNPYQWEDDILAAQPTLTGPYLTTRDRVKAAFGFKLGEHDERIDQLLPQVTELFQTYCDRQFIQSTVTEYPPSLSSCMRLVLVKKPPIASVTSCHFSDAIPRVYDASTLLVEGTDFIVSEDGQWIEFVSHKNLTSPRQKTVKLVYTGGFAVVPADLEHEAIVTIGVKALKMAGRLYHLTGITAHDGTMQGLRFDDLSISTIRVLDSYRLRLIA